MLSKKLGNFIGKQQHSEPTVVKHAEKVIFEAATKQSDFKLHVEIRGMDLNTKEFVKHGQCYMKYTIVLQKLTVT